MSHEDEAARLKSLFEDLPGLRWCLKHELVVWYEGALCPACELENDEREAAAKKAVELFSQEHGSNLTTEESR